MPKEITADLGQEYALLGEEIENAGGVLRKTPTSRQHHRCRGSCDWKAEGDTVELFIDKLG